MVPVDVFFGKTWEFHRKIASRWDFSNIQDDDTMETPANSVEFSVFQHLAMDSFWQVRVTRLHIMEYVMIIINITMIYHGISLVENKKNIRDEFGLQQRLFLVAAFYNVCIRGSTSDSCPKQHAISTVSHFGGGVWNCLMGIYLMTNIYSTCLLNI